MSQKRKSPLQIVRSLMESLETEPKTVKQLSTEIGSNWETALNYLELVEWVQRCPKVSRVRITKQIESWRREWGRLP